MGRRKLLSWDKIMYDAYIVGENLRKQMHEQGQIKDRRYHLRKYKQCMVGRDTVDWLVKLYHVTSRDQAVEAMNILCHFGVVHHVSDEHEFKDQHIFYRFSFDDNTYLLNKDLANFYRGLEIHNKMRSQHGDILRDVYHKGVLYKDAFYGSDAVDFIMATEGYPDRDMIIKDFRHLLEGDIIKHVTDDYHFTYDRLIYEFNLDFNKNAMLQDLLETQQSLQRGEGGLPEEDAASHPDKTDEDPNENKVKTDAEKKTSDVWEDGKVTPEPGANDGSVDVKKCDSNSSQRSTQHDGNEHGKNSSPSKTTRPISSTIYHRETAWTYRNRSSYGISRMTDSHQPIQTNSKTFVRQISLQELENSKQSVYKMSLQIDSDKCGFGFSLKGSSPSYVQTVDPLGPAAAAGLKVNYFISEVNGEDVKKLDHTEVGRMVVQRKQLHLVVLVYKDVNKNIQIVQR